MAANANLTKSWYQYVSDDGTTYRILYANYIAAQVDGGSNSIVGATAATMAEPRFAKKAKPRRALFRDEVAHVDREVIVLTPTAPVITIPQPAGADTLQLNNARTGLQSTFTYQKHFLTEYLGPAKP